MNFAEIVFCTQNALGKSIDAPRLLDEEYAMASL